jgi:hypothetical protein
MPWQLGNDAGSLRSHTMFQFRQIAWFASSEQNKSIRLCGQGAWQFGEPLPRVKNIQALVPALQGNLLEAFGHPT